MDFNLYDKTVASRKKLQLDLIKALRDNIKSNLPTLRDMYNYHVGVVGNYMTFHTTSRDGIVLFKDELLKTYDNGESDGIVSLDLGSGNIQIYATSEEEIKKAQELAAITHDEPLYFPKPTTLKDEDLIGILDRGDNFKLAMFATTPQRLLAEAISTEQYNIQRLQNMLDESSADSADTDR